MHNILLVLLLVFRECYHPRLAPCKRDVLILVVSFAALCTYSLCFFFTDGRYPLLKEHRTYQLKIVSSLLRVLPRRLFYQPLATNVGILVHNFILILCLYVTFHFSDSLFVLLVLWLYTIKIYANIMRHLFTIIFSLI